MLSVHKKAEFERNRLFEMNCIFGIRKVVFGIGIRWCRFILEMVYGERQEGPYD